MKALVVLFAIVSFAAFGCNSADEPMAPSSGGKDGQVTGSENKAVQEKDIPIYFSGWNPCCEEWVEMTGTGKILFNKNGFHLMVNGLSGSGYSQVGGTSVLEKVSDSGYTYKFRVKLANDQGCSYTVVLYYKIQLNANGEIVVETNKYEIECG